MDVQGVVCVYCYSVSNVSHAGEELEALHPPVISDISRKRFWHCRYFIMWVSISTYRKLQHVSPPTCPPSGGATGPKFGFCSTLWVLFQPDSVRADHRCAYTTLWVCASLALEI